MLYPGHLYVAATLLPLASFVLLLIGGGIRALARAYRSTPAGAAIYRMGGGDHPGRLGSYIATAAIAAAFVCSLTGFILYQADYGDASAAAVQAEQAGPAGHEETAPEHVISRHGLKHTWEQNWTWIALDFPGRRGIELALGYRIDHLTAIMFMMVTFIATLIHIFSMGYMADELKPVVEDHQVHTEHGHLHRRGRFGRFFMFLSLFCFSMLNLVLADNLFQVFISWELVGICSFLLVGFYYERQSASNAANKAFITNRIGDAGFILGMIIIWAYVGTFNFEEMFRTIRLPPVLGEAVKVPGVRADEVVRAVPVAEPDALTQRLRLDPAGDQVVLFPPNYQPSDLTMNVEARNALDDHHLGHMPYWLLVVAGLGIFLGCVGKSAQFPLHVWLPDAMEGPTPVSALIHAATMVAAGVYLVGRVYPLFTPESRLVIAYVGAITLFVAATIALVMTDIKKVLAYSTVSQLGYLMLALGVGGWVPGLFHLHTHAFFKALLFLCSGSVIYGCHHEQEMTKMGGLFKKMPITALTMLTGVLAIAGIPLFSGWYSKDAVLAHSMGFASLYPQHFLLFLLPLVTAGITTFYMFRMWYLTFSGTPRDPHVYEHARESPLLMTLPLIVLAFFSIVVAWGPNPLNPLDSHLGRQLQHAQPPSVDAELAAEEKAAGALHSMAGNITLGVVILCIVFATLVYKRRAFDPADAAAQFPGVYRFLQRKWYFDELYSVIVVRPALAAAGWCKYFDLRGIDGFLHASARSTTTVSRWHGMFDRGVIDGIANLIARVFFGVGSWLKNVQTGYLRSYVLFLVMAAVGLFFVLSFLISVVRPV